MKKQIIHQSTQGDVALTVTQFGNPNYSPRLVANFEMQGDIPARRVLDHALDVWLASVGCTTCAHKSTVSHKDWSIITGVSDLEKLKATDVSTLLAVVSDK